MHLRRHKLGFQHIILLAKTINCNTHAVKMSLDRQNAPLKDEPISANKPVKGLQLPSPTPPRVSLFAVLEMTNG